MFYSKLTKLCADNNTNPYRVCKILGFSNSTSNKWKNGATPNKTTLHKIANFFNVPIEYFENEYIENTNTTTESKKLGTIIIDLDIMAAYNNASDDIKLAVRKLLDIEK